MEKYLSNTELFYSNNISQDSVTLSGEEQKHLVKVMRHSEGDLIHVTDGSGNIYETEITFINKEEVQSKIIRIYKYNNVYKHFWFCIPKLKNPDRFEFALEKCTEMGITNFIVYQPVLGVNRGVKTERWEKITISAMKQSLRSYKPVIEIIENLEALDNYDGIKVVMDQNAENILDKHFFTPANKYLIIFGPESGFEQNEVGTLENKILLRVSPNRLRTETAIVKTSSILTL